MTNRAETVLQDTLSFGIVGGSLVGLSTAIALARCGADITVFDRDDSLVAGTGLGVNPDLIHEVCGEDPRRGGGPAGRLPLVWTHRYTTSWDLLHGWLRNTAAAHTNISVRFGERVTAIAQTEEAAVVVNEDGRHFLFDCVLGADGYRSTTRSYVCQEVSDPNYGGALIWRGIVNERDQMVRLPPVLASGGDLRNTPEGFRLIAYPIPGPSGETEPGNRRVNWGWYDRTRLPMLEQLGCVRDGKVLRSARHSEVSAFRRELIRYAESSWSSPWREYVTASLQSNNWFATPVAEFLPAKLANGRVAILGDAAHVTAPTTGAGLETGLQDVLALMNRFRGSIGSSDIPGLLREYEKERLLPAQRLVRDGSQQMMRLLTASS